MIPHLNFLPRHWIIWINSDFDLFLMKKQILSLCFLLLIQIARAQIKVEDFYRPKDGKDDAPSIQRAMNYIDSLGHGTVEFSGTKNYLLDSPIELPRYSKAGRRIIILNGNGCSITGKSGNDIFRRIPADQKEALDKMMSTRFLIRDFSFQGGKTAINLGASYGSAIENCNFTAPEDAAIDVQFGLSTSIRHCSVTNPKKDAFVLRCGNDWGGNTNNSQSNHSVIEMCRVYATKTTESSFKILGSGGVVLRDAISEGSNEANYSVYFDRLNSTTVRMFTVENFHLEHAPKIAGIYLNHTGIATIDGLFAQLSYKDFPLIMAAAGAEQITLRNIPHHVDGMVLYSGNNEVPWRLEYCHKSFYQAENWRVKTAKGCESKTPFYFSGIGGKFQIGQKYGK